MLRLLCTVIPLFALAACSSGGGAPTRIAATDIRKLTGSQAPVETPADQTARAAGIVSRSDSLIYSTLYGETSNSSVPTFRARATCSGTRCFLNDPQTGLSLTIDVSDLEFVSGSPRAVLTKHGITTIEFKVDNVRGYGAWMNHSAFQVINQRAASQDVTVWARNGMAGGDLTGSRPVAGSATWHGLMIGVPASASHRENHLQGDAVLTYGFSGSLDAAFTNIKNLDTLQDHSVTNVRFNDVPVSSTGTFQAGLTGNRIQGGFYGPGHAETAGVFEQSGIVGSFGAKRQ